MAPPMNAWLKRDRIRRSQPLARIDAQRKLDMFGTSLAPHCTDFSKLSRLLRLGTFPLGEERIVLELDLTPVIPFACWREKREVYVRGHVTLRVRTGPDCLNVPAGTLEVEVYS